MDQNEVLEKVIEQVECDEAMLLLSYDAYITEIEDKLDETIEEFRTYDKKDAFRDIFNYMVDTCIQDITLLNGDLKGYEETTQSLLNRLIAVKAKFNAAR